MTAWEYVICVSTVVIFLCFCKYFFPVQSSLNKKENTKAIIGTRVFFVRLVVSQVVTRVSLMLSSAVSVLLAHYNYLFLLVEYKILNFSQKRFEVRKCLLWLHNHVFKWALCKRVYLRFKGSEWSMNFFQHLLISKQHLS